jgi:chromosome partitioning protein
MTNEIAPVRLTTAMLKGGGTRTTSAVFTAIDLARRDPTETVLLVDADTQNGTAYEWIDSAGDERPANLDAAYWPVSSFADRALNYGAKHIVVDTGNDAVGLEQALTLTDHVLVTVKPSGSEIARVRPTLNVITSHPRAGALNVAMLITRGKARTRSLADAQEVLSRVGDARLLSTIIPEWELYAQAYPTIPDELGAYPTALDELLAR